jgi:hypothetical protein
VAWPQASTQTVIDPSAGPCGCHALPVAFSERHASAAIGVMMLGLIRRFCLVFVLELPPRWWRGTPCHRKMIPLLVSSGNRWQQLKMRRDGLGVVRS